MGSKTTMKVDTSTHQKLQIVKGMIGTKTLSETIRVLAEEYIAICIAEGKK